MTTYAWPSITPTSSRLEYRSGLQAFPALSGALIKERKRNDLWRMVLSLETKRGASRAQLQALALKLLDGDHNITIRDYGYTRRGSGAGTPLINGANQTGARIQTDGWTSNAMGVLLEGDEVQIRNQLCMLLADVNANSSGQAELWVRPQVRFAPDDNSALVLTNPTGTFKLLSSNIEFSTGRGYADSDFVFDFIEDVLA